MTIQDFSSLVTVLRNIVNLDLAPYIDDLSLNSTTLSEITQSNYQVLEQLNSVIGLLDGSLIKGDKGDPAPSAPYGFFDLGAVTIPAVNSSFSIPDPLYGDLITQNGNILLKAGYSYDITVNFMVNFTSTTSGYLVYDIVTSLFSTPSFQEVAMVSSASGFRDAFPLRFITPRIDIDLEIPLFARARASCTALLRGNVLVRGHYV